MVKLIHCTPKAEELIAYMARVSSPHQDNPSYENLIGYLIREKHWSPLEMVNLCVEIYTSRAISQQILRHRSFSFQEFSLRYTEATNCITYPARRQDTKNRQNSIDDMNETTKAWFESAQSEVQSTCLTNYEKALELGIAKEQARMLLPLSTQTKLYMNGTIRSWVHYLQLRLDKSTQLEHREIALEIQQIFKEQLPVISKVLGWL